VSEWVYTKPAETSPSAEQSSINRQTVERALSLLNDRERSCLLLRAEGLSYAEIGQVLEISAKSVSVYLARGVKKVRSES
jgi:RNA polymerase sigma factor (sigma-70 family)